MMQRPSPGSTGPSLPVTPPPPTPLVLEQAYRLGRKTLAPIFAAFAALLLAESRRRRHEHLVFLARDGQFLLTVTERLATLSGRSPPCTYTYVHLTRRSTALVAAGRLGADELAASTRVRAGGGTWASALSAYGIESDDAAHLLALIRAAGDERLPAHAEIARRISQTAWRNTVGDLARQRRDKLLAYLQQTGLTDGSRTALVDIGWRATIQQHLARITNGRGPPGLYLGLWEEGARVPVANGLDGIGLLTDYRRGRTLREASAWYAAFLLEAICRADEGTTVDYRQTEGRVEPVLAGASRARSAERQTQEVVTRIRRGILDGLTEWQPAGGDEQALRRRAQYRLLRLAFFPDASAIAVARHLVHTEGHTPDWSAVLVSTDPPNPLRAPRRWLAGLASPWRAGYVRASAGLPGAILFALAEASLIALPPSTRIRLQSLALRVARLPPATPQ